MKNIVKKISQNWYKNNHESMAGNVQINQKQTFSNNQQQVEQINNSIQQFVEQPEHIQVLKPIIEVPKVNSLMISNKTLTRNSRFDNVEMFEAGLLSSDSKLKLENF